MRLAEAQELEDWQEHLYVEILKYQTPRRIRAKVAGLQQSGSQSVRWIRLSEEVSEGHQKVHAAEAAQKQIVSEAPLDDSDSTTTELAPTLPKMKNAAQLVPTPGTAAGKGTPSSGRRQAREKGKESDQAEEMDNEDAGEKDEEEDPDQVLQTQQKRKQAPTSHFDASPDDASKHQPKEKAKTAASAEFKLPSRSGSQASRGAVASPSGGG